MKKAIPRVINQFSDKSPQEFKKSYLFSKVYQMNKIYKNLDTSKEGSNIDWFALAKVEKVRDQRNCGSC